MHHDMLSPAGMKEDAAQDEDRSLSDCARVAEQDGHAMVAAEVADASDMMSDSEPLTVDSRIPWRLDQQLLDVIAQTVPGGAENVHDVYPLSPLQEGMLFHSLLNQRSDTYVLSTSFELQSREHVGRLAEALQNVVDRHDVLRSAMLWEQVSRPLQVVYRHAALPIEEITLDPNRDLIEQLRERMQPGRQSIELRRAPLARLQVAADPRSDKCYALLQIHHLVCDHQSLRTVVAEALACLQGRGHELPAPVPYRDYVSQALMHVVEEDAESFFRCKLGNIDEPTAPLGLLEVYGDGSQIEEMSEVLEPLVAQQVRTQARGVGVSAARLFHAAWALVVAGTTGRDDVVYGTVLLAGLQRGAQARRMLGMTVNTLPLRLDLRGTTVKELVELTHRELTQLLNYEYVPLTLAQRCSGIGGSAPLFTTLLNYRHSAGDASERCAAGVRVLARGEAWTNYPITVLVDDVQTGFLLTVQADRRVGAHRVLGYLRTAVHSVVQALEHSPIQPAAALSIVPASERRELVELFNATRAPFSSSKLLHQMFEEQVARTPAATAVVYDRQSLTYGELNRRSNQLARFLQQRGVGPDQLVGLCIERSLEMVIGLLGILKAGGAYVPLDPHYPSERLQYMLENAAPRVLLTQDALRSKVAGVAAAVVALDSDWAEIARRDSHNLDPSSFGLSARHLAYVIYTSGSTGRPKGAMNEHRGVVNRLEWMQRQYQLGESDRVLQKTPFSFDVSVWEFLWTLSSGAQLIVARPLGHQDPGYLLELIEQTAVTTMHFVPSMLQVFLGQHRPGWCPSVRRIVCSGEELSPALQNKCLACLPHVKLTNLYGPTEAAIDVTYWECEADVQCERVPIGRPIANTQIYILGHDRQPTPLGVAGEIYLGGVGVGRGYWNQPALTAERFVLDPFSADPDARLYKTGDLGRWRRDGAIEYLGRNDHQVKIRGLRIEPGEIEAQLTGHPQVSDAIVIAREDTPGDKRLVAYVVTKSEQDAGQIPLAETLRVYLKSVLPDYMIPSAFVLLETLPLTPNGKLDRRALPVPQIDAYVSRQYEQPQGEVEEILASIWQGLLGIQRVGRHDNFFELGGHSLLIVQMMERLRRVGLSAQLRSVFDSPRLADLARVLISHATEQFEVPPNLIAPQTEAITPEMLPLIELQPENIDRIVKSVPGGVPNVQDIYPLAPLQEGILFHHLLNERSGDTYVLVALLSVASRDRLSELIGALQAVVNRHDILRTAILWEQLPRPVQVVYRHAILPTEEIALDPDREPAEHIKEWMKPERQSLDLCRAPLMRVRFAADRSGSQWYVLLQLHHMAIDHVTLEIVTEEAVAHLRGCADSLPPAAPYRNHVAQSLARAALDDAQSFFRSKFGDVSEPTAPFGLLDVHGDCSHIEEAYEELDTTLARRIRSVARCSGVTVATLFHAAWALVVAHTSGRDNVVFGSVLLGRLQGDAGAQRTLGMLINTLPLHLQLGDVSAKELVEQTQRELVELLSHEQASLATAQRSSGITGTAPLFTTLLNYRHSAPQTEKQWGGASGIQLLAIQERTNYPIALTVDDYGEKLALTAQTDRRVEPHRITGYLSTAVRALVEALEQALLTPVLRLPILPQAEHNRLVRIFNATSRLYPRQKLIHELFEEQVERTPRAVAAVYEGRSVCYADLNGMSNRLAHYLRSMGLTTGGHVAVLMSRSLPMLVAQLAILKAGGVYVPMDPELPVQRQAFMVADCAARVVVGDGAPATQLQLGAASWIDYKAVAAHLEVQSAENLSGPRDLFPPAYVMYTSGSTGVPKGVIVPHHAVNRLAINNGYAQIGPTDCIAHYSNPAFDASTFEIWGALLNGARVVIVPQSVVLDATRFAEMLREQGVTVLWMTVGLFNQYTQSLAEVFRRLRYLIVGGDSLEPGSIRRVLRDSPPQYLLNAYGPTECTTFSTTHLIETLGEQTATIPIGRPIANAQIYILDRHQNLAPLGAEGEIYIGGAGVACGYLNRPELTALRFVPDPFSSEPQARFYRTGDMGRWRSDGVIEFLGRNDQQVKIRGFRIEPGEIEAQLVRHAQVIDAAVVTLKDVSAEKRLIAYAVPRQPAQPPTIDELRAHLKSTLPEFMLPSAFVTLDRLPLTPTGKVDRLALPVPQAQAYATRDYQSPQGEVERIVAEIWQELLGVERIGRRDDFFELGGHSLLALRATFRVNELCNVTLRVSDIYRNSTIRELAERIRCGSVADDFVDMTREAVLDENIAPLPGRRCRPAEAVLLTGATGFVGRFLLAQLLQDTDATIYCLVRSTSQRHAAARIEAALAKWDLWHGGYAERIVAIAGDLRLPSLGLDESTHQHLCRTVDHIYHCGTSMNHLETYSMAKATNVESAREILRMATQGKPKLVNYVSTLSVFRSHGQEIGRVVDEASVIDHEKHPHANGYAASKWVSEKIFMTASARGIPCNIFRLGLVWADTRRGRYDELQREYRVVKSCLLSGCGIENYSPEMPLTPVDYVAQAVVYLTKRYPDGGGIFHLSSPNERLTSMFERCNALAGTNLELMPHYDWICRIKRLHLEGRSLPVVPLLEFAFSMDEHTFAAYEHSARGVKCACARTQQELEAGGVTAPMWDDQLLERFVEDMRARDAELCEWQKQESEVLFVPADEGPRTGCSRRRISP